VTTSPTTEPLSAIEQALVSALTAAIVHELKDERPEQLGIAAGRDVRDDEDHERDESYTTPPATT
jgi:hypothetical protein